MKRAFTLSEVLITIGVIGVVSAMTLPTLINKYQEKVTVTKVKKFNALMNQNLLLSIKDNGFIDEWTYSDVNDFAEYILPHLKVIKNCKVSSGCIASNYKYLNGDGNLTYDTIIAGNKYYKLILADGTCMWFRISGTTCSATDSGTQSVCGLVWIDINGKKEPNTLGKDTFCFFILKNRIIPHSGECLSSGYGCSRFILQNGNMNYLHK